jgi:hypothetical protein
MIFLFISRVQDNSSNIVILTSEAHLTTMKHKTNITHVHFSLSLVTLLISRPFEFFTKVPPTRNSIQSFEFRVLGTRVQPCGIQVIL